MRNGLMAEGNVTKIEYQTDLDQHLGYYRLAIEPSGIRVFPW